MGKQKHDAGFIKRKFRNQEPSVIDGGLLARRLVERGLASKSILDRRAATPGAPQTNPTPEEQ